MIYSVTFEMHIKIRLYTLPMQYTLSSLQPPPPREGYFADTMKVYSPVTTCHHIQFKGYRRISLDPECIIKTERSYKMILLFKCFKSTWNFL